MSEIVNGNQLDKNQSKKTNVKRTKFPIIEELHGTYRFGEYGIGLIYNGIAGDKVRIRQSSEVDSYTLQAPLKTPISMNKTYFQVTRQSILPKTWEKIYTNPSIGQDVNASEVGTSVKPAWWNAFLNKLIVNLQTDLNDFYTEWNKTTPDLTNLIASIANTIESLMACELIFSNASLINAMGANFHKLWNNPKNTFEEDFETFWSKFDTIRTMKVTNIRTSKENIITFNLTAGKTYDQTIEIIDLKQWLEEYRDGERFQINWIKKAADGATVADVAAFKAVFNSLYNEYAAGGHLFDISPTISYGKPVDIGFPEAYQLSCAEFFTNDKVDYIYNAELYRQYMGNLLHEIMPNSWDTDMFYTLNGIKYERDYLSAYPFYLMANDNDVNYRGSTTYEAARAYIFAIFKYNRSLKYKDYFVGSRTRPIAIDTLGKTDVQVESNNTVQVVNIAKGIQWQRFLYVVNKIPRDLKGYTKGIVGKDVAPDWHNPLFLGRVSEVIFGQETENTGTDQLTKPQTRTSTLKNQGKNYRFEFTLDRNSIIIGMVDFDIPRSYSKGVSRMFMDVDRFDMFNPYLQYTGDQEVYGEEINARWSNVFGYQGPYMHMKQGINRAFGGFIENLKGWTFLDEYINPNDGNGYGSTRNVGPDFIRSKPSELNRFFISLTGNSMGNYYHFIIDHTNYIEAIRPMSYNPQILG